MGADGRGVPRPRKGRGRDSGGAAEPGGRGLPRQRTAALPRSGKGTGTGTGTGKSTGSATGVGRKDLPPSDGRLVERTRRGDEHAYAELCRRHVASVRRYARRCCRDERTADDLTAEIFARALQALRRGAGPDTAVRAYLLSTVKRVAASWGRTAGHENLVDDFAVFASRMAQTGGQETDSVDPGPDVRAMHEAERSLAVRAFRSLPERWQTVLWHTTVENESPRRVAPHLGLNANATAALAHRARSGLRQAYLQAHVSASLAAGGECARFADRMGAYARGGLRMRAERGLRRHLGVCARCRAAALEVRDVSARLRGLLPVAVIGWFASGYALDAASANAKAKAKAKAKAAGTTAGDASGAAPVVAHRVRSSRRGIAVRAGIATGVAAVAAAAVFVLTSGDGEPDRPQARTPVSALPAPPPFDRPPDEPEHSRPEAAPASSEPSSGTPWAPGHAAAGAASGTGGTVEETEPAPPVGQLPGAGPMQPAPPSGASDVHRPCGQVVVDLPMPFDELSSVGVALDPGSPRAGWSGSEESRPVLVCG